MKKTTTTKTSPVLPSSLFVLVGEVDYAEGSVLGVFLTKSAAEAWVDTNVTAHVHGFHGRETQSCTVQGQYHVFDRVVIEERPLLG